VRKIASEARLCKICMEQHDVDVVEVMDEEIFKGEEVVFKATYEYCPNADEYLETEEMVKRNSLAMKDAYRQKVGLLTSGKLWQLEQSMVLARKLFRRS